MSSNSQLDNLSLEELYDWVNKKYEAYNRGEIEEEDYLADLDFYKKKLALSEKEMTTSSPTPSVKKHTPIKKVRSTSIAGLRKKLLEELRE